MLLFRVWGDVGWEGGGGYFVGYFFVLLGVGVVWGGNDF